MDVAEGLERQVPERPLPDPREDAVAELGEAHAGEPHQPVEERQRHRPRRHQVAHLRRRVRRREAVHRRLEEEGRHHRGEPPDDQRRHRHHHAELHLALARRPEVGRDPADGPPAAGAGALGGGLGAS